jgi:hypothetical protein
MNTPDGLHIVMVEDSVLDAELLESRLKRAGLPLDIRRRDRRGSRSEPRMTYS